MLGRAVDYGLRPVVWWIRGVGRSGAGLVVAPSHCGGGGLHASHPADALRGAHGRGGDGGTGEECDSAAGVALSDETAVGLHRPSCEGGEFMTKYFVLYWYA